MDTITKTDITVEVTINASIEKVWDFWTNPFHIIHWNAASGDWQTTYSENEVNEGGMFLWRMEAKDGSSGFNFEGVYDEVKKYEHISYTLGDGRKVNLMFRADGNSTTITETFETETTMSVEMQQQGWQSILNNFKEYVESDRNMEILHYEILINAYPGKVFETMLNSDTYSEWTVEFNASSRFEGSWEKGKKIIFIGTDEDGKSGGMVSRIKENIPHKFVSVEHLGIIHDGKEITDGEEVKGWAGALENYTFTEQNGKTLLSIDVDTNKQFKEYFGEAWPKALNRLKDICER